MNLEASVPPFKDQVTVSLAENVWTVLIFSLISILLKGKFALSPWVWIPPGPVIIGSDSLTTSWIFISKRPWVKFPDLSVALTHTS